MASKVNARYMVAVVLMLLFIFNDLLFDFAFTFKASDYIALMFTILSAIIVFVCNNKIKNDEYKQHYYETTEFIKSNFDNAQVVFSILDIVCGVISILSSYMFLACTFKVVKIFYIPTKVLVVANKEKSLLKPITKFSYLWSAMRILEKGDNKSMKKFLGANKFTILIGLVLGAFCGLAGYYALPTFVVLNKNLLIVASVVLGLIAFGLAFFLGRDTVEGLALRFAKKNLPEDKYNTIIGYYNNAVNEIEVAKAKELEDKKIEAEAMKRLKAEKKVATTEEDASAKAEFEAKVNAKISELKANENNK